jgi:hypothetical protein
MEKNLYAIQDVKGENFESPIAMANDGDAVRGIGDVLRDEKFKYFKHIADYRIMCLGTYDIRTGIINALEAPRFVISGENLVNEKEKNK